MGRLRLLPLIGLLMAAVGAEAASDPKQGRMQGNLQAGLSALEREQFRAAVTELERAIVADPRNTEAYVFLGRAHHELGRYGTASKYYRIALQLEPTHRLALLYLGRAALETDDLAAAQEALATLDRHCASPCPELDALQREISRVGTGKATAGAPR